MWSLRGEECRLENTVLNFQRSCLRRRTVGDGLQNRLIYTSPLSCVGRNSVWPKLCSISSTPALARAQALY